MGGGLNHLWILRRGSLHFHFILMWCVCVGGGGGGGGVERNFEKGSPPSQLPLPRFLLPKILFPPL